MAIKVDHPELTPKNWKQINTLLRSLARDAHGPKGRIVREDILVAAQLIGESLVPPVDEHTVLSYVMGPVNEARKKPECADKKPSDRTIDLGGRKVTIKVTGRTPKSQVEVVPEKTKLDTMVSSYPSDHPASTMPKAQVVTGEDDPFSKKNQSIFRRLSDTLKDLKPEQTMAIPFGDWDEASKMREIMHGVAKKLNWIPVVYDNSWRAYLITVKGENLYVHRLG